ncbi:hypothetical protein OOZ19_16165 [Saccharopolyspora sp. NFXS83]|uniref:alpha/beta hydrolase family protein n=1 Tax=Saccharopolyspora sp. NFXS83 TaxID=2993560 RepID=UPI00224AF7A1|nr:hypothetical protein [Saccharopolyspora sp. NFXS83]MCX2731778.1 hypothetical protein [Saccharopolyspora sp. NFXS83]
MPSRTVSAHVEEEARVLGLKPVLAPGHGRYGDHPHHSYDAWPAEDPDAPLVVLLHGGYWRYDRMHLTPFADFLARQGFSALLPGFRRSGGAGGYPETFDDVARIVDTLPADRPYVLAGHCSGGHLALWCAARGLLPADSPRRTTRLPNAVLALAPITDLDATRRDDLSDGAARQLLGGEEEFERRLPLVDPVTPLDGAGSTGCAPCCCTAPPTRRCRWSSSRTTRPSRTTWRPWCCPEPANYALIEPENPAAHHIARTLCSLTGEWTPTRADGSAAGAVVAEAASAEADPGTDAPGSSPRTPPARTLPVRARSTRAPGRGERRGRTPLGRDSPPPPEIPAMAPPTRTRPTK